MSWRSVSFTADVEAVGPSTSGKDSDTAAGAVPNWPTMETKKL